MRIDILGEGSISTGILQLNLENMYDDIDSTIDSLNKVRNSLNSIAGGIQNLSSAGQYLDYRIKSEENKLEKLDGFARKVNIFLSNTIATDKNVASIIADNQEKFYNQYAWLRPSVVEEKSWWEQRVEDWNNFWSETGEAISSAISSVFDYVSKSVIKFIFGDFWEGDNTLLSILGSIVAGIFDVDIPMDIRDIIFDITHWGEGDQFGLYFALDLVALIPVIGAIKYFKYADEVADGTKFVMKNADDVADVIDDAKDIGKAVENGAEAGKTLDNAVDVVDDTKDLGKNADEVVEAGKAGKNIPQKPLSDLPQNVQDSYKKYEDVNWGGNYKDATPGTSAGGKFKNIDNKGNHPLPTIDKNGNPIFYNEFDVNNKPPEAIERDSFRFVRGSDGSIYYTYDHYDDGSFIKIK